LHWGTSLSIQSEYSFGPRAPQCLACSRFVPDLFLGMYVEIMGLGEI